MEPENSVQTIDEFDDELHDEALDGLDSIVAGCPCIMPACRMD